MAISVANETNGKQASPSTGPGPKPDVEKIMADIRRAANERAAGETKSEREFKADLKKRMMLPLSSRGLSEDFAERVRSREASRWNIQLKAAHLHGSASAPMRALRWVFRPLAGLLVNLRPAVEQAARQAEINEYHRRLLWATNRDLELARLEINLIKSELRRLGVHADFSFSPGPGSPEAPQRSGQSGRGRQDGRGGRGDRSRGDRRRGDGGRSDRDGGRRGDGGRSDRDGGRRDRQGSGQGSRPPSGQSGQPGKQGSRQGNRPSRGGRRAPDGGGAGDQ